MADVLDLGISERLNIGLWSSHFPRPENNYSNSGNPLDLSKGQMYHDKSGWAVQLQNWVLIRWTCISLVLITGSYILLILPPANECLNTQSAGAVVMNAVTVFSITELPLAAASLPIAPGSCVHNERSRSQSMLPGRAFLQDKIGSDLSSNCHLEHL